MIPPMRYKTARYGEYSKAGENVYDHPFQWGSKRTGPDLAREGGLRGNMWHYEHFDRPKDISKGSIMPAYTWLRENDLNTELLPKKIEAMQTFGVPYAKGYSSKALADLKKQAHVIAEDIVNNMPAIALKGTSKEAKIKEIESKEVIALIAYMQRLGTDIKVKPAKK